MQNQTNTETLYHPNGKIQSQKFEIDGVLIEETYNEAGCLVSISSESSPSGYRIDYTYDNANNLLFSKNSEGTVIYTDVYYHLRELILDKYNGKVNLSDEFIDNLVQLMQPTDEYIKNLV